MITVLTANSEREEKSEEPKMDRCPSVWANGSTIYKNAGKVGQERGVSLMLVGHLGGD